MAVKIKVQKDYYLTEVTIEPPADLGALDALMKATKGTGKITSLYSQGGPVGVNVEQRTKIPESVAEEIRRLIGIGTKIL
jgi:hypothetical protein